MHAINNRYSDETDGIHKDAVKFDVVTKQNYL